MLLIPLVILSLTTSSAVQAFSLSQAEEVGQKIWKNECNQTIDGLIHWNLNENFPSLGIGHFIWYPAEKKGPFVETFPELIQFLKKQGVAVPRWLNSACPWNTHRDFLESKGLPQMQELRQLLARTVSLQAKFIAERFEKSSERLIKELPEPKKEHVITQLARLKKARNGYYALVDYLNFKGDGLNPNERYKGQGWGLLQVLEAMPGNTSDPVAECVQEAKCLLKKRVENSPPERCEQNWLQGWCKRLQTYLDRP